MSATLFFLLLHTTACVDEQEIGEVHGGLVFMEMTVPGLEIPTVTRSMEGNKGEAVVKTIDLLIFDKSAPAS